MAKPIVAVVGRPNVGKSTLFNKIIGKRLSIVDDTPGVTRDRIYGDAEWLGRKLMLVDTGGIEPKTDDVILAGMRSQAQLAIDMANVIIFVVDLHCGVTATDAEIAAMLQRSGKPVVVNIRPVPTAGNIWMEGEGRISLIFKGGNHCCNGVFDIQHIRITARWQEGSRVTR